jgi:enoyl-[acyl-carrier protein] reductase I
VDDDEMGLLTGKTLLVMGVANKRSIAWGIARSCYREGARLVFTYQGDRQRDNLRDLLEEHMTGEDFPIVACDVTDDDGLAAAFQEIGEKVGTLHGLAHCIAFAKTDELQGEFVNTSRDGYLLAQNVSAYSMVAVARHARPLLKDGGSLLAMTYIGGERVVENYNVMGVAKAALEHSIRYLANDLGKENIRVNAISAGPIRTLSAKAIHDFNKAVHEMEERTPLRRSTTPEEVGDVAAFLFSDLSRGVTGETIHVDEGFHILGV